MDRTRLEWAQWMALKGITAFIVNANSKRPLGGNSWYTRQTTDPTVIAEWFRQTLDCNYGLHLGAEYLVVDLDIKPQHNGVHEFETICHENGVDSFLTEIDTLMVKTPSGGYHLYFKSPFPCANRNHFPDGIDVRGVIGYVVGPGSEDSRGKWELVDSDAEITELPEWLIDYIEEPGSKDPLNDVPVTELDQQDNIDHSIEWLKRRDPAIEGQNGDDHTYETIQFLRDFGLSEVKILQVINDSGWNIRCEPPWGDSELEAKISNAWTYGQNRPGIKSPTYKVERLSTARPAGGWAAHISEEQMVELFHPTRQLTLVVDNDEDDEIPTDVMDDKVDPVTGEAIEDHAIFSDVLDFAFKPAIRQYVVHEWLLAHGITHLIAKRGTGKSTVALDLAYHIACDMEWCGAPTQTDWKVIYICGEDDVGMRLNCRAWMDHHGRQPDRGRFWVADEIIKLTEERRLNMRLREMVEWADDCPTVVILDTWQRATSGKNKSDQEAMELAVEYAEHIAEHMNGPLLSCVHPPKDGRMTVVGSGVQEDTSTGIWFLEKEYNGVKLTVNRIKGPGENRYMRFDLTPKKLDGVDAFDKPLSGLVAMKTGGSEDKDSVSALNDLEREQRAWADAIRGVERFPKQDNGFDPVSMDVKNTINFIIKALDLADDPNALMTEANEASAFIGQYMQKLKPFLKNISEPTLKRAINRLFVEPKVFPTVYTNDGKWQLMFAPKPDATGKRKYFSFKEK